MSTPSKRVVPVREVQRLALTGYDTDFAWHVVLTVRDAGLARSFVAGLLGDGIVTFGDHTREHVDSSCAVNIGFTFRGLQALGVSDRVLDLLASRSPAFVEGAAARAASRLGDTGNSAAERWEARFRDRAAAVWIAVHGDDEQRIDAVAAALRARVGADGLDGWDADPPLRTTAISGGNDPTTGKKIRKVHFGFRDNISQPRIEGDGDDVHAPGELLLGYANDQQFDLWTADPTPAVVAEFLRNASFGVLRKIEQDEERFNAFLGAQVRQLQATHPFVNEDYLKAKLCGRWVDGELVQPGATAQANGTPHPAVPVRPASGDAHGLGCPFGAHIRRTNPRGDAIRPPRLRTLFRRGMPYGTLYSEAPKDKDRGLMGVFFCAGIEDQFERLVSEWVEKNPLGPANPGRAKDPLIGHHDDPEAAFHIPQPGGDALVLEGFSPFVTTRGTLYALFPGRAALAVIARATGADTRPTRSAAPSAAAASPSRRAPPEPDGGDDAGGTPDDAPSDRFCDVVMEGGITSGIIYTAAVAELARHYRFRNVGGSSIGAFAAALAAAAEFRRRRGSSAGFAALGQLPAKLAEEDHGQTLLERLFVPQATTRRLFAIFVAMLNRSSPGLRILHGLGAALRQYGGFIVAVTLVLLALLLAAPLLGALKCVPCASIPIAIGVAGAGAAALVPALLLTLVVSIFGTIAGGVVWDFVRGLVPNGFGLCRGWDKDADANTLNLAGFLHQSIQKVAGLHPIDGAALTFKDLWHAPGAPRDALGFPARGAAARSINLEVYSANLTHGRPYRFPLDEAQDMGRLFFRVEDLAAYFPAPVLMQLQRIARPYEPKSDSDPPAGAHTLGLLELPVEDLPIVVAVRLAMSFPLLISAVPLYAIDYEQVRANRRLAKCWMSDGGLCSNFPIHLFDSFIPMWPTFGISLSTRGKLRPTEGIWLPDRHRQGRADTWDRSLDEGEHGALSRLGGFLVSLWRTAWHWNDSTMMRMPGVRDRVVRIYLKPGEGGVNIRMPAPQILGLASNYGTPAAKAFLRKFALPGAPGWTEHRWLRFTSLLVALRDRIVNLRAAAGMDHHALPLGEQIADAQVEAPLRPPRPGATDTWPSESPLTEAQAFELRTLLAALEQLQQRFESAGDHEPYRAIPRPSLRARHPT